MTRAVAGRYELSDVSVLGSMGELFEAYDRLLDRRVAVKRIQPGLVDDPEVVRRFEREARLTARVSHPGVPVVFDTGRDVDGSYLVMEFIEGRRLDELIAEAGPLATGWIAAIGAQVAAVLARAHAVSLIHRDLNPANIMIRTNGTVAVIDFGVATMVGASRMTTLTGTGQVVGTAEYQAPERRLGVANPLTDLYAVGKVLAAMAPPDGGRDLGPDGVLGALVAELTSTRPSDRPGDPRQVVDRLVPLIGELGPLPGFVADGRDVPSHVRAYAAGIAPDGSAGVRPPHRSDVIADSAHLRRQAERLGAAGQVRRAVGVLDHAVMLASGVDDLALSLRWDRVRYLVDAGDHELAVRELPGLTAEMISRFGSGHPAVLSARSLRADVEAACGRVDSAIAELRAIVGDLSPVYGREDARQFPFRLRLGVQLAVAGKTHEAREVLRSLERDQRSVLDSHHPELVATLDALAAL